MKQSNIVEKIFKCCYWDVFSVYTGFSSCKSLSDNTGFSSGSSCLSVGIFAVSYIKTASLSLWLLLFTRDSFSKTKAYIH